MYFKKIIKEELLSQINEDIWSDKIKQYQAEGVSADIAKYYVDEFKKLKSKLNAKSFEEAVSLLKITLIKSKQANDINSYANFKDLETLVDYINSVSSKRTKSDILDIDVSGGEEIYEDENLVIWLAKSKSACIKYSNGYGWCVGRQDSGNMYYAYRFKDYEPTFYFVKDVKKAEKEDPFTDKYHFFVIQVTKYGDYIVTSANNDGDKEMSWSEIERICPLLKGKENLFKHRPIQGAEKEIKDRFYNKPVPSAAEFKKLSYEEKESYLDIAVKWLSHLPNELFLLLPDDLKKKFIGFGLGITDEMLEYIDRKPDLRKYKTKMGQILLDKKNLNDFRKKDYNYIGDVEDLDFTKLSNDKITYLLSNSPIAEKIWNLGKFDKYLDELDGYNIRDILTDSPIAEKIWDSGKLDKYLDELNTYGIRVILTDSPIAEKIWDSGKLDKYLDELNTYGIRVILTNSPIAEKIWDSGKLDRYLGKLDGDNISFILVRSPISEKLRKDPKFIALAKSKGVQLSESRLFRIIREEFSKLVFEKEGIFLPLDMLLREISDGNKNVIEEAEYKGRKVTLNKPFRTSGESKKFAVYVKNKAGNIIKVRFGDPTMRVNSSSDKRANSFAARHNCKEKKDKTKAGYWSCRINRFSKSTKSSSRRFW